MCSPSFKLENLQLGRKHRVVIHCHTRPLTRGVMATVAPEAPRGSPLGICSKLPWLAVHENVRQVRCQQELNILHTLGPSPQHDCLDDCLSIAGVSRWRCSRASYNARCWVHLRCLLEGQMDADTTNSDLPVGCTIEIQNLSRFLQRPTLAFVRTTIRWASGPKACPSDRQAAG